MRKLPKVVGTLGAALALALTGTAADAKAPPPTAKPTKVVVIVVDALSREIVDTYDMKNVKGLFPDDGVGRPGASVRR